MKNLRYLQPLTPGWNIRQTLLHRVHDRPPPLRLGIRSHLAHVSVIVAAMVFEVGNEKIAVKVDRVIPNVAGVDRCENRGPNLLVVFDVLVAMFRPKSDQLAVTTHNSLRFNSWLQNHLRQEFSAQTHSNPGKTTARRASLQTIFVSSSRLRAVRGLLN